MNSFLQTLKPLRREFTSKSILKSNAAIGDDGRRVTYTIDDGAMARITNDRSTPENVARKIKNDLLEDLFAAIFPNLTWNDVTEKRPRRITVKNAAGEDEKVDNQRAGEYVRPNEAKLWNLIVKTVSDYFEVDNG